MHIHAYTCIYIYVYLSIFYVEEICFLRGGEGPQGGFALCGWGLRASGVLRVGVLGFGVESGLGGGFRVLGGGGGLEAASF